MSEAKQGRVNGISKLKSFMCVRVLSGCTSLGTDIAPVVLMTDRRKVSVFDASPFHLHSPATARAVLVFAIVSPRNGPMILTCALLMVAAGPPSVASRYEQPAKQLERRSNVRIKMCRRSI